MLFDSRRPRKGDTIVCKIGHSRGANLYEIKLNIITLSLKLSNFGREKFPQFRGISKKHGNKCNLQFIVSTSIFASNAATKSSIYRKIYL